MNDEWITRKSLLLRAKDPYDNKAWDEFVKYYKKFIHLVLLHINFHDSDYGDIEQEVLLKIWKQLPSFDVDPERAQFRTWLSVLIRNSVIDYIRKDKCYATKQDMAKNEALSEDDVVSQHAFDEIVEHEWVRYLTTTALDNIQELFSGVAVEAFELSLLGKTSREIGEQLGINHESVKTLRTRVKLRLVKEIDRLRRELEL